MALPAGSEAKDPVQHSTASAGWSRWLGVGLCAGGSALLYGALLVVAPDLSDAHASYVGTWLPTVAHLTQESLWQSRVLGGLARHTAASARFPALLLGLFVLYGLALHLVSGRRSRRLVAVIFGSGALFLGLQFLSPVLLSSDLFGYAMHGRVLGLYREDPYIGTPALVSGAPYLALLGPGMNLHPTARCGPSSRPR